MATTISTQDLIDVKRDIDDIGKAVNEKVIVSPRYGDDFKSLPMIAEEFQISSDAAEAAAVTAVSAAQSASASANIAEAAATSATISAGVFDTPEAGVDPVTGVADGEYYNVRSPSNESYIDEYQNLGGVATPTGKSYPSSSFVNSLKTHNNLDGRDAAGAHPASAISDASGFDQGAINRGVDSIDSLRLLSAPKGTKVYLNSVNKDQNEGGGYFVATQKTGMADNGGTVVSSSDPLIFWVRIGYVKKTPEMFGAVSGEEDSTDALLRLFQSAGDIHIPSGRSYGISNYIDVASNSVVSGGGTIFRIGTNKNHGLRIIDSNNITLTGFGIDLRNYVAVGAVGSGNGVFIYGNSYDINILGMKIKNTPRDCVYIGQASQSDHPYRVVVDGCLLTNANRSGVSNVGGEYITVKRNIIKNFNLAGINFEAHNPATLCRYVDISGNQVFIDEYTSSSGISVKNEYGLSADVFKCISVVDNVVSQSTPRITSIICTGGNPSICANGNTVINPAATGIVGFKSMVGNLIYTEQGVAIATPPPTSGTGAIVCNEGSYVIGNRIINVPSNGIASTASSNGSVIKGNYIENAAYAAAGDNTVNNGILLSQGDAITADNIIRDTRTTPLMGSAIRQLRGTGSVIRENLVQSSVSHAISVAVSDQASVYSSYEGKPKKMSSLPTTGVWQRGDTIYNSLTTNNTIYKWVCTQSGDFSGTPPVFKAVAFS